MVMAVEVVLCTEARSKYGEDTLALHTYTPASLSDDKRIASVELPDVKLATVSFTTAGPSCSHWILVTLPSRLSGKETTQLREAVSFSGSAAVLLLTDTTI